jgi:hypothetical protein
MARYGGIVMYGPTIVYVIGSYLGIGGLTRLYYKDCVQSPLYRHERPLSAVRDQVLVFILWPAYIARAIYRGLR